jgi:indolepyruvate ferredoxin oxidoreductase, alpha subunit
VIDPHEYQKLMELVKQRLEENVLSVIITRSPCKLIMRERRPAPSFNKELCKKCGLCLTIDCPGLVKLEDGSVELVTAKCAGCYLCTEICPPHALAKHEK